METLLDVLEAADAPRNAIVLPDNGLTITYGELRQRVRRMAFALERGARLALALPNGVDAVAGFLAASAAGTAAPLNPGYKFEEFCFYLSDTGARALMAPAGDAPEARRAASETGIAVIEPDVAADGEMPRPA